MLRSYRKVLAIGAICCILVALVAAVADARWHGRGYAAGYGCGYGCGYGGYSCGYGWGCGYGSYSCGYGWGCGYGSCYSPYYTSYSSCYSPCYSSCYSGCDYGCGSACLGGACSTGGCAGGACPTTTYYAPSYYAPTYSVPVSTGCGCASTTNYSLNTVAAAPAKPTTADVAFSVSVPADAKIFVNDRQTVSTGAERQYVSKNLNTGSRYAFTVRAERTVNGQTVSETQIVKLTPGESRKLSFTLGGADAVAGNSRPVVRLTSSN